MIRRRERGCCHVTTETGEAWILDLREFERVRTAWIKGVQFVDTVGLHGERLTIRLTGVDSVVELTAEQLASQRAEHLADDADDALAGAA